MGTQLIAPAELVELEEPNLITQIGTRTDWTNEQRRLDFEIRQWEHHQRAAALFVRSGCFADIKGATQDQAIAQAMVKIELGRSMGFCAAEAMKGIDLIQGRPAIAAELRAARMAAHGYSWDIVEQSEKRCAINVYLGRKKLGLIEWTIEEATRMGLTGKDNWKKNPSDMLWARCITRAQRRLAPHVLSVNILSREEAIDIEPIEDTEPQAAIAGTRAKFAAIKAKSQANATQVEEAE
jgi:hypothetical protein